MGELEFFLEEDTQIIRLTELQNAFATVFHLPAKDVERMCQIANDKCQGMNPMSDDATETWIDAQKLMMLINA